MQDSKVVGFACQYILEIEETSEDGQAASILNPFDGRLIFVQKMQS